LCEDRDNSIVFGENASTSSRRRQKYTAIRIDREERQVVPDRSQAVIRTEQENAIVPDGPNDPRNERSDNEAVALGEFGTRNPRQPISSPKTVAESLMTAMVAVKKK